jgi:glycosyltransferase involved in cell wall biosynthesis
MPRPASSLVVNGRFLSQELSGVQRYALELTRALVASGADLRVACPADVTIPEELSDVTVRVGHLRGHAWEQRELPAFARSQGSPLWSPGNTGPVVYRRQLVTLHDMFPYSFRQFHTRAFRLWYRAVHRGLALRRVRFAAVSAYTRDEIVRYLGVPAESISIVPNGIGERFRRVEESAAREVAGRLGFPPRYVLSLGAASGRKNIDRLIAAWSQVRQAYPGVELVLAGGTPPARIFAASRSSGEGRLADGVRRVERIPEGDLPAIYSAADALVMPSLAEGFGLPPLEAAACGTPIVVSGNSALVEVFGPAGAVLVDPYSIDSIAHGVMEALGAPSSIAAPDRARLVSGYSWSRSAERLMVALSNL